MKLLPCEKQELDGLAECARAVQLAQAEYSGAVKLAARLAYARNGIALVPGMPLTFSPEQGGFTVPESLLPKPAVPSGLRLHEGQAPEPPPKGDADTQPSAAQSAATSGSEPPAVEKEPQ